MVKSFFIYLLKMVLRFLGLISEQLAVSLLCLLVIATGGQLKGYAFWPLWVLLALWGLLGLMFCSWIYGEKIKDDDP